MRSAAGTPTMLMHLMQTVSAAYSPVWKSKFYGAFVLNHRVVLQAIDATPARWRGDAGSSPLDRARSAASLPRNDLVKNCRVHPTHRLISTQPSTCRGQSKRAASRASSAGCRPRRRPGAPAAASGTSWARDPSTCGRTRAGSAGSRRGRASPGSAAGAAACPSAGARRAARAGSAATRASSAGSPAGAGTARRSPGSAARSSPGRGTGACGDPRGPRRSPARFARAPCSGAPRRGATGCPGPCSAWAGPCWYN